MQPTIIYNPAPLYVAADKASDEACKIVAKKIAKSAKGYCPKRSGDLSNSIEDVKSKFKGGGYIVQAYGNRSAGRYYASFIELGAFKTRSISPQPFLRPAKDKHKHELSIEYERAFSRYER